MARELMGTFFAQKCISKLQLERNWIVGMLFAAVLPHDGPHELTCSLFLLQKSTLGRSIVAVATLMTCVVAMILRARVTIMQIV